MKKFLRNKEGRTEHGTKKPLYRRWWFIAVVVLIIFSLIKGGGSPEEKQEVIAKDEPPVEVIEVAEDEEVEEEVVEEELIEKTEAVEVRPSVDDLLEKYSVKAAQNAELFLEQLEKVEVKTKFLSAGDAVVAVYSEDKVLDQSGAEFKYSFVVQNQYTIKATGDIVEYVMTLGYKSEEDIDNLLGYCLQYFSETGNELNVMDPEYDV